MHDVRALAHEQAAQRRHVAQGQQRLAADVQGDVLGPGRGQRRQQPAAGRHHQRAMPGGDQRRGDFQGGAFDAAGFQRRQQLHHGQALHRAGGQSTSTKTAPQYGHLASWLGSSSTGR